MESSVQHEFPSEKLRLLYLRTRDADDNLTGDELVQTLKQIDEEVAVERKRLETKKQWFGGKSKKSRKSNKSRKSRKSRKTKK